MTVHVIDDSALVVSRQHLTTLRSVVEMYVLRVNAERSMELDRDLLPDEKFLVNEEFGEILTALEIDQEHWRRR